MSTLPLDSPRIDAHHHLWRRDQFDYRWLDPPRMSPIRRDFLPVDLQPQLAAARVQRSIVVQTQHNTAENDWALSLADEHDWIAGVVGWVDLASDDCERQLLNCLAHPKFVGVRHVTHDEADDDFIVSPRVLRGLAVLERHRVPFDLLFYVKHLPHAATLAQAFPQLRLVIDHLSKPPILTGQREPWATHLRAAAQFPNVYCKLSGMITEASWHDWQVAQLQPYVEVALSAFGAERCMFGSDWPVCLLAGSYTDVVQALEACLQSCSDAERRAIWAGTAASFYNLPQG